MCYATRNNSLMQQESYKLYHSDDMKMFHFNVMTVEKLLIVTFHVPCQLKVTSADCITNKAKPFIRL